VVFFAEDCVLIKVLRQEKDMVLKTDRRISQRVADIVRLEERYVLLLHLDSHMSPIVDILCCYKYCRH